MSWAHGVWVMVNSDQESSLNGEGEKQRLGIWCSSEKVACLFPSSVTAGTVFCRVRVVTECGECGKNVAWGSGESVFTGSLRPSPEPLLPVVPPALAESAGTWKEGVNTAGMNTYLLNKILCHLREPNIIAKPDATHWKLFCAKDSSKTLYVWWNTLLASSLSAQPAV